MNSFNHSNKKDSKRLLKAAQQFLEAEQPPSKATDETKLSNWLENDECDLHAYKRIASLRYAFAALKPTQKATLVQELLGKEMTHIPPCRHRFRPWAYATVAASVIFTLTILLGHLLNYASATKQTFNRTYATAKAQNRDISLPDGTHIVLAAESELHVTYKQNHRDVTLKMGEAFFHVHHLSRRPFIVYVGNLRIQDLGTIFDVHKNNTSVTIAVTHGSIAVTKVDKKTYFNHELRTATPSEYLMEHPLHVSAGYQVVATISSPTLRVEPINRNTIASWQHGWMQFEDTPLSTVIENLNRYSRQNISIADPRINKMHFTGTVALKNISEWLKAASRVFHLREKQTHSGGVILYVGTVQNPRPAATVQGAPRRKDH